MATVSAKVEPPKSTFFGYNQARTISNISAHGSSTFNFCKDKTPLRNAMCLVVEELVKMYNTVCFGEESFAHESAMFSSSRFGGVIVFMTAFIEIIIQYQNTPDLWKKICEPGKFLILANTGANRVTLGRGKEIYELNIKKNAASSKKIELPQESISLKNFETNKRITILGEYLSAPIEIFTFERSHSKELLINVRRIYDTLGYAGPQSISNLKKAQQDFNSLSKTDRETLNSAGNGGFSGVHLSICQYCKQDGEILTAVCTIPFDVTDLFNYESLCNGHIQYNTTKAGGEKTGWVTINSTQERRTKILQAKTYIILVLKTINEALDDEAVLDETGNEKEKEKEMKVKFFEEYTRTGKNIIKIEQINSFALHVVSSIVSHLILSLILESNEAYTPFAPIDINDSETSIINLIEKINHCKSYHYSNACRVVYGSTEDVKIFNESKEVQHNSQDVFIEDSKTDSTYIKSENELKKYHSNSSSSPGGGAAKSNSGGVESNSMVISATKSNSSSAAGGGAESNGMTIDDSAGNEEITPPLALFEDMNKLIDTGLFENDENEIDELIQIFDPTFVRTETDERFKEHPNTDSSTKKRKKNSKKTNPRKKKGGCKSKKQSRRNKKYTR
jgi:hypothetical protein